MAMIFEFALSIPKIRTFKLFGDADDRVPTVRQISLGFLNILIFRTDSVIHYAEFLKSALSLDQFLAGKAPIVRLERKKAYARVARQARNERLDYRKMYVDELERLREKNQQLNAEVRDMTIALKVFKEQMLRQANTPAEPVDSSPSN